MSFLLQLSGMSALLEATDDNKQLEGGTKRPELRRMCSTIAIFLYGAWATHTPPPPSTAWCRAGPTNTPPHGASPLYRVPLASPPVRLFAVMRGTGGMLQKQKYSLAVMMAGTAMMPVGWQRFLFPTYFWAMMCYNRKTAAETLFLVRTLGVDGAASKQLYLA